MDKNNATEVPKSLWICRWTMHGRVNPYTGATAVQYGDFKCNIDCLEWNAFSS